MILDSPVSKSQCTWSEDLIYAILRLLTHGIEDDVFAFFNRSQNGWSALKR